MVPSPSDAEAALPTRQLPKGIRRFLDTEASGGLLLLGGAVAALVWANSPWKDTYSTVWGTPVDLTVGNFGFHGDLLHLVNEGLMTLFFFVVGLEIKRELVVGDLREWRTAALPVIAATGGMVVPALIYAAVNASGEGSSGWGVPMATDIAFAVGIVALLGNRVPASLKLFLLSLAIVDDIGAIAVIAIFYSKGLDFEALVWAVALTLLIVVLRRAKVVWGPLYLVIGIAMWLSVHQSGVHATIAGVVLAFLAPARPLAPAIVAQEWSLDLSDEPSPHEIRTMTGLANATVSAAERLQNDLHPVTSFLILPLFALANAGVALEADALAEPGSGAVAAGVVLGLVVGKLAGITGFCWLGVRFGPSPLPDGSTWRQVVGIAAVAGIGFTVSLFIAELAFTDAALVGAAKIGVLVASAMAAAVGVAVLWRGGASRQLTEGSGG